ncbi:hypothetical protein [Prosthecobacter sp.]|uniref:hypothetical protein n=1 Tax=Prosthecobacter sp. TaxID=1965333 RepID=UPI003783D9A5
MKNPRQTGKVEHPPQGLIAIILWGFGSLVGTYLAGRSMDQHKLAAPNGSITHDSAAIWAIPARTARPSSVSSAIRGNRHCLHDGRH